MIADNLPCEYHERECEEARDAAEPRARACTHCQREVREPFLVCRACLVDIFIGPRPEGKGTFRHG